MKDVRISEILILIPRTPDGGCANYYTSLRNYYNKNIIYFARGKNNWPYSVSIMSEIIRLSSDYINYMKVLRKRDIALVQVNTFLGGYGVLRDLLFLLLAKLFHKKTIWFFRGWDPKYSNNEMKSPNVLIKIGLLLADSCITLSQKEKEILNCWGFVKPIFLETTTYNTLNLSSWSENSIIMKYNNINCYNILFMGRIDRSKGIFELIYSFKLLLKEYNNINLIIAGRGQDEEEMRLLIENEKINNIVITGFVQGEEKSKLLKKSHIFVLPSYSEGMPNSVLEAFAYGLPIVTTKVGGLIDIFKEPENGVFAEIKDINSLSEAIKYLISNPNILESIAINNYHYALNKFHPSIVTSRLMSIYQEVINLK